VKQKIQTVWGLFARFRLLRWGLFFLLLCLGILILSASRVSFFGITIERDVETFQPYEVEGPPREFLEFDEDSIVGDIYAEEEEIRD